jgi:hypothetical protein
MEINFIKVLQMDQNILQLAFASCHPQGLKVVKNVENSRNVLSKLKQGQLNTWL